VLPACPASRAAIARRDTGDESLTDIARSYNVSHSTISRL
jgi:IS30 family transposase